VSEIQQFFRDQRHLRGRGHHSRHGRLARGKIMPAAKFAEDEGMRLPESVFLQTVTGDYPPDPAEAMSPAEIDFVRLEGGIPKTVRRFTLAAEPTAQVMPRLFLFGRAAGFHGSAPCPAQRSRAVCTARLGARSGSGARVLPQSSRTRTRTTHCGRRLGDPGARSPDASPTASRPSTSSIPVR